MSTIVTMAEAQAHLPELVAHLGSGDEVIITQDEKPVARLVRENPPARKPRKAGNCIGMVKIVADDDEHLKDFEERPTTTLCSVPFREMTSKSCRSKRNTPLCSRQCHSTITTRLTACWPPRHWWNKCRSSVLTQLSMPME